MTRTARIESIDELIAHAGSEGRHDAVGRALEALEDLYIKWGLDHVVHPLEEAATDEQLAEAHEAVRAATAKD